ncbi:hypothetical protein Maq22A_c11175 [Methylobacterium aquaticum]|uniref:Uncharacterized protein n=1 Tax=Methylobacterium aquaticum TaxID=270351 RepID=A0A0C6FEY1_9HYPH|nr:hypothetical protein Maq22A_c11175 [Methylobacterium aquaticum]
MIAYKIPRARAIIEDIFYASGIPSDNEIEDNFTRLYQYYKGGWGHADAPVSTQYIALYHRPEGG